MNIDNNFTIFEGMTSVSALIHSAEENPTYARKIIKIVYDCDKERKKLHQLAFLRAKSKSLGFSLEALSSEEIDALATGTTHGGFLAFCTERTYPELSENAINRNGIYYLLEGIEDPYNFGYVLRALYASGADGAVLSKRNWMTAAGTVAKSSAGCSELLPLFESDPEDAVKLFKSLGFKILSANIRDSELIYDADLKSPLLFIIGGEKRGISRNLLGLTDQNIRIGYGRDFSGSLPSAEATAIIAFEVAKYNKRIK